MSSIATEVFTAQQQQRTSLSGSRVTDFFLLGGLAVLFWLPMYFFENSLDSVKAMGLALPGIAVALGYWVNYPHFMASYKLAYTQGQGFIVQNWFQLILVPVVMLAAIVVGFLLSDVSISNSAFVLGVNGFLEYLNLDTRLGLYPNLGSEILGFFITFMYFTVGWHYSKQTFGCMMVYAKLDNYALNNWQRNLIRYSLLSTWWVTWLYSNCSVGTYPFYNLTIHRLGLPYWLFQASYVVLGLMFTALAIMFAIKLFYFKQKPSWNFLVPMLALLIWHVPLLASPQYFVIIAFFHSLQYFPFVAKVEATRYRKKQRAFPYRRLAGFFAIMAVLGYLFFNYIPNALDSLTLSTQQIGISYFLIGIIAFINIHHYFIDNVLWRFKNKEVRELLLD